MTIKGTIKNKVRKYRHKINKWYYEEILIRLFKHYEEEITEWAIDTELLRDYYNEEPDYYDYD